MFFVRGALFDSSYCAANCKLQTALQHNLSTHLVHVHGGVVQQVSPYLQTQTYQHFMYAKDDLAFTTELLPGLCFHVARVLTCHRGYASETFVCKAPRLQTFASVLVFIQVAGALTCFWTPPMPRQPEHLPLPNGLTRLEFQIRGRPWHCTST